MCASGWHRRCWFQLTAARRRLGGGDQPHLNVFVVSTHSRPKAAGAYRAAYNAEKMFQLTAARRRLVWQKSLFAFQFPFQLTAARRRLDLPKSVKEIFKMFQLTAARRRLVSLLRGELAALRVSTHSRPKAAGRRIGRRVCAAACFNSQPPEGGWAFMR